MSKCYVSESEVGVASYDKVPNNFDHLRSRSDEVRYDSQDDVVIDR